MFGVEDLDGVAVITKKLPFDVRSRVDRRC